MFGFSAFSQIAYSALATAEIFGSASITANADVTANAYAERLNSAAITANASVDATADEIAKRQQAQEQEQEQEKEQMRLNDYRNESDPLFFKYQRGEIDKQVWLDKVQENKDRYQ